VPLDRSYRGLHDLGGTTIEGGEVKRGSPLEDRSITPGTSLSPKRGGRISNEKLIAEELILGRVFLEASAEHATL